MANSALTVANTNFNDIKASLKTFLKSQSEFQDFNFEGSNLNVLLDLSLIHISEPTRPY